MNKCDYAELINYNLKKLNYSYKYSNNYTIIFI